MMTIQVVVLTQYSPALPCNRIQLRTNTSWIDVTQKLGQCRRRSMCGLVAPQCCLALSALPLVTVNGGLKRGVGDSGRTSASNSTSETSLKMRHYHAVAASVSTDISWTIFSSHFCTFFIAMRNVILCRTTDEIQQKCVGNLQTCKFRVSMNCLVSLCHFIFIMCAQKHTHTHTHTHTYIYIYIYTHINIDTHTYIF